MLAVFMNVVNMKFPDHETLEKLLDTCNDCAYKLYTECPEEWKAQNAYVGRIVLKKTGDDKYEWGVEKV